MPVNLLPEPKPAPPKPPSSPSEPDVPVSPRTYSMKEEYDGKLTPDQLAFIQKTIKICGFATPFLAAGAGVSVAYGGGRTGSGGSSSSGGSTGSVTGSGPGPVQGPPRPPPENPGNTTDPWGAPPGTALVPSVYQPDPNRMTILVPAPYGIQKYLNCLRPQ